MDIRRQLIVSSVINLQRLRAICDNYCEYGRYPDSCNCRSHTHYGGAPEPIQDCNSKQCGLYEECVMTHGLPTCIPVPTVDHGHSHGQGQGLGQGQGQGPFNDGCGNRCPNGRIPGSCRCRRRGMGGIGPGRGGIGPGRGGIGPGRGGIGPGRGGIGPGRGGIGLGRGGIGPGRGGIGPGRGGIRPIDGCRTRCPNGRFRGSCRCRRRGMGRIGLGRRGRDGCPRRRCPNGRFPGSCQCRRRARGGMVGQAGRGGVGFGPGDGGLVPIDGCGTRCPNGRIQGTCRCRRRGMAGIGQGDVGFGQGDIGFGPGDGGFGPGDGGFGPDGGGFGPGGGGFGPGNGGIGPVGDQFGTGVTGVELGGGPFDLREKCYMPKMTGGCRATLQRYYYDTLTQQCIEFVYGGCGGNGNNFKTLKKCKKTCIRGSGRLG